MLIYSLVVLLSSIVAVILFWLIVIGGYWFYLGEIRFFPESVNPSPERNKARRRRLKEELKCLQKDLGTIMTPIDPTAKAKAKRAGSSPISPKLLTESGSAENRTISQRDLAACLDENSDIWLCDGRPLFFAVLQLPPVVLLTACLSLPVFVYDMSHLEYVMMLFAWATLSTLVVSLVIGWFAAETVQENTVIGVYRFRSMCNGFLGKGLQFTVPFFERSDEIPFQTLVWGPQTGEQDDGFHIDGTAGVDTNPSTGLFAPLLRGRWPIAVIVQVTFHFERGRKRAWWEILNRWSEVKELGEQIASTINAVLVTRVRELDVNKVHNDSTTKKTHNDSTTKKTHDNPTAAMESLNVLQDELPEICGPIILALQELRADLPVIFERVQISAVKAGEELQQLLQKKDEAWTDRFVQEKAGEAMRDRLSAISIVFEEKGLKGQALIDAVMEVSRQDVQKEFARAGNKDGSVEAFVRAITAKTVTDVTEPK